MTLSIFLIVYGVLALSYGLYWKGVEAGRRAAEQERDATR